MAWNDDVIKEFRENGGKVGGIFAGQRLVLVHTIGAKSGQERLIPLVAGKDGETFILIASKGGAPTNPDWYYNLKAHPEVTVEFEQETFQATATEETGAERDRLYKVMGDEFPQFYDYQEKTTRTIPLFSLKRNS